MGVRTKRATAHIVVEPSAGAIRTDETYVTMTLPNVTSRRFTYGSCR